ncbi:MAG: ABC transporter ATP-binding protein [Firmicutes bacterium HGW-Firmicutes-2]|jgi:ABC-2 type transport system ATP-binding protein|nr:MAG: ABC transporter ATP-binding protein [Firmicutes bacterium HGW-Firmicutes-2]
MIEVKNMKKSFKQFEVLKGLDLNVKHGEIYGFIGKNGAGKSTTMNILAGLSKPTDGVCLVGDVNVSNIMQPSELDLGYLPEDPKFYPWFSAYETLVYLGDSGLERIKPRRIHEILEWGGLLNDKDRRVGTFSRGMKQRLGICSAILHDPSLLILDEPSSALDPQGRNDVLQLIKGLKEMGKTVLFSSHILNDVERVCDKIGIIASGKMVLEKSLKNLEQSHFQSVYDVIFEDVITETTVNCIKSSARVLGTETKEQVMVIKMEEGHESVRSLMQILIDNDLKIVGFNRRKHTLEDIFIKEVHGL